MKFLGLIGLVLLLYVPGWATWLLFNRKRLDRQDPARTIRNLFCQVAAGTIFVALVSHFLGLVGVFNIWAVAGISAGFTVVVLLVVRPRFSRASLGIATTGRNLRAAAPLIACLLIGFFLFMTPFMSVLGGADEGLYPNIAGTMVRTGSVYLKDPVVPTVNDNTKPLFYRMAYKQQGNSRVLFYSLLEPGLYITNFQTGKVTPQFFYLYPSLMAVFMGMIGLRGGFFVLTFFALMCVWAMYLLAKEVMARWASFLAALFLAVNFLEVYFAKFSTAEIATQFFFLVGLYAYIRMRKASDSDLPGVPWWGSLPAWGSARCC